MARLIGRSVRLEPLNVAAAGAGAHDLAYVELRAVAIDRICGTEEQAPAFDSSFCPVGERPRNRWVSIAEARIRGDRTLSVRRASCPYDHDQAFGMDPATLLR